jgi:hypothetical protein
VKGFGLSRNKVKNKTGLLFIALAINNLIDWHLIGPLAGNQLNIKS